MTVPNYVTDANRYDSLDMHMGVDSLDSMHGFSQDAIEELAAQGISPWEPDARAALNLLHGLGEDNYDGCANPGPAASAARASHLECRGPVPPPHPAPASYDGRPEDCDLNGRPPDTVYAVRHRAVDVALALACLGCCYFLYLTAKDVIVYLVCGLMFMSVAAFSLVQSQLAAMAQKPMHKLGWFACTGGTVLLFIYWALTTVFRAPIIREDVGCGGVQYIHDEL